MTIFEITFYFKTKLFGLWKEKHKSKAVLRETPLNITISNLILNLTLNYRSPKSVIDPAVNHCCLRDIEWFTLTLLFSCRQNESKHHCAHVGGRALSDDHVECKLTGDICAPAAAEHPTGIINQQICTGSMHPSSASLFIYCVQLDSIRSSTDLLSLFNHTWTSLQTRNWSHHQLLSIDLDVDYALISWTKPFFNVSALNYSWLTFLCGRQRRDLYRGTSPMTLNSRARGLTTSGNAESWLIL